MAQLGVPILTDPNNGTGAGAMLIPNDINSENQTRSDARRSYYDPFSIRSNFHVLTNYHVTKLLLKHSDSSLLRSTAAGKLVVDGVEVTARNPYEVRTKTDFLSLQEMSLHYDIQCLAQERSSWLPEMFTLRKSFNYRV